MRKIIIREDAFNDLDSASAYIGENSPHASVGFLEEAQKVYELIAEMPGIGSPRDFRNPELHGMRVCPVPRFRKYLIFYLTTELSIEIVRVLHGSRDIATIFSPNED